MRKIHLILNDTKLIDILEEIFVGAAPVLQLNKCSIIFQCYAPAGNILKTENAAFLFLTSIHIF